MFFKPMLDIGWSELLVVVIVAIVVVGPKDLPKLMRTIGFYAGKARRMAADFQRQFNEVLAESEAEDVRMNLEAIRANMGPAPDLNQPIGKPLMTGPEASTATEFVEPPRLDVTEPPLPKPQKVPPAKQTGKRAKTTTKKTPAKKATAKKTAAKKSPAKRRSRKTNGAAGAPSNGEPKP